MSKSTKTDKQAPSTSRRKTLKKLGMGGAIVSISKPWQKPVVDSIVLPAHARTSTTY